MNGLAGLRARKGAPVTREQLSERVETGDEAGVDIVRSWGPMSKAMGNRGGFERSRGSCLEKPLWVGKRDEVGREQGAGRTSGGRGGGNGPAQGEVSGRGERWVDSG